MSSIQPGLEKGQYLDRYLNWINSNIDEKLKEELYELKEDEIKDRFYKYLEFGTGGMRGEIGAGTNRINKYIVRRATQGLAQYIQGQGENAVRRGVVIAYDSRQYSREFAEEAALVLAKNGIKAYVFDDLRPTPELSFAVRELGAIAGIVITASHNPPEYNGYKIYWKDGGQIPPATAAAITECINQVTNELEVQIENKDEAIRKGLYDIIGSEIDELYLQKLQTLILNPSMIKQMSDDIKIVYTPLHGTGYMPVCEVLKRAGFKNVIVVPEQAKPDPMFSSVKSPNPEDKEAFALAIELAKKENADLILGTDPDTDRVGAVVQNKHGEYVILTGNQTGALLLDYLLSQKKKYNQLPKNGVVLKTIVTSELGRKIAAEYGLETIDTLTGFKFIGEKIKEYEETGEKTFVFGYEESYGYLIGDFVRDKDGVQSCLMISEMAAYYKSQGLTLYEALQKLYRKYGYYTEDLVSLTLKGIDGQEKIKKIMEYLRNNPLQQIGDSRVKIISDYLIGTTIDLFTGKQFDTGLPQSDVLRYTLEDGSWFAVRPSGTEPKIKFYFGIVEDEMNMTKATKLTKIKFELFRLIEE